MELDGKTIWTYDLEVFPNFFLATFYDGKRWVSFREDQLRAMTNFARDDAKVLCGYNNFDYDDVVMRFVMEKPRTPQDIFRLSMLIISERSAFGEAIFRLRYSDTPWAFSVDVFQLLNKKNSLKEWGCREGCLKIVEAAHSFEKDLPPSAHKQITDYCRNDVLTTHQLLEKNWPLVTTRTALVNKYDLGHKVYVLSEAGIAQHAFMTFHKNRTGQYISRVREVAKANPDNRARVFEPSHIISKRVRFSTKPFNEVLTRLRASSFVALDPAGASWRIKDDYFKKPIQIWQKAYKIGVGGLHSVDGPGVFNEDADAMLVDLDVASYYPSIIINDKLAPRHIGAGFLKDMINLRDDRLKAKRSGDKDTNEALKIVINSTFGKLNDAYSPIRSIADALRVTINGQLMLLMLIEKLELYGAEILSANTDGVLIRWERARVADALPTIMKQWEAITACELERTDYQRVARRDVNAYIALACSGKVKRKGAFEPRPRSGKWDGLVVKKAAEEYLLRGVDPMKTIRATTDPVQFLYYQRIKNGGTVEYGERPIPGRTVRWYVAKTGEQIRRRNPTRGGVPPKVPYAKIPNGANARLALDITNWDILGLEDVDHQYYAAQAWELIRSTEPKKPRIKKVKA